MIRAVLFDWGNTVMVDGGSYPGPMCTWPAVRSCPHVGEALRALSQRYTVALATNADDSCEPEIRLALKRVRLNCHFRAVFCSNELGVGKPSPEFFGRVLGALSLPPHEVVMVGDNLRNDVLSPLEVGLRALWYRPGETGAPVPEEVIRYGDHRELPALVAGL